MLQWLVSLGLIVAPLVLAALSVAYLAYQNRQSEREMEKALSALRALQKTSPALQERDRGDRGYDIDLRDAPSTHEPQRG